MTKLHCSLLLKLTLLGLLIAVVPHAVKAEENGVLDRLIQQAQQSYPEILKVRQEVRQIEARYDQVTSLPDPMASVSYSNVPVNSWNLSETPMSGLQVMWTQNIPWLSKLRLQGHIVTAMARVKEESIDIVRLEIRKGVQDAYYELLYLQEVLEVLERNHVVLQNMNELAHAKYTVGKGLQTDLLQVQVELTRLETKKTNLLKMRDIQTAKLRTWVGSEIDLNITLSRPQVLSDLNLSLSEGRELLFQTHPKLHMIRAKQHVAREKERRARLEFLPNFQIQAAYRYRDDNLPGDMNDVDLATIGAGITVPLFGKPKRAQIQEAKAEEMVARHEEATAIQVLTGGLEASLAQFKRDRELLGIYHDALVPQAEQSFHAAQSAYQVGSVDFLTLLNTQLLLLRLESEQYRLQANHQQALAAIEFLVGMPESRIRATLPEPVRISIAQPDTMEDSDVSNE